MICAAQNKFPASPQKVCLQFRGLSLEEVLKDDLLLHEPHNVKIPIKSLRALFDPISPLIS